MTHNPYAPPTAAVVLADDGGPTTRPADVKKAVILFWLGFALGILSMIIDWREISAEVPLPLVVSAQAFSFAITAWLTWKIWVGRNWARITMLVLTGISLPFVVWELIDSAGSTPLTSGLGLVEVGMELGALYLLFFPGREWFRQRKSGE